MPLLLFVAVIDPLTDYLSDLPEDQRAGLWATLAPGSTVRDFAPLWFVAALLTFSLCTPPGDGGARPAVPAGRRHIPGSWRSQPK